MNSINNQKNDTVQNHAKKQWFTPTLTELNINRTNSGTSATTFELDTFKTGS